MDFFVKIPSKMTEEEYTKYNRWLITCLLHILTSGRLWAEEQIFFVDKLKDRDKAERNFALKTIDAMKNADTNNDQVKSNLVYLGQMLVGSQYAITNAKCFTTSLYHTNLIMNWPDVITRISNPEVNIHDDEPLIKAFVEKIKLASKYDKTNANEL